MDQITSGRFIAARRKELKLTQAALAEQFNITDKAVSKWETGRSFPDASIIMDLCRVLDISVNELMIGKHIEMNEYRSAAEQTLLDLKKQNEQYEKMLLDLEIVLGIVSVTAYLIFLFLGVSSLTGDPAGIVLPAWLAIVLIILAFVILFTGVWFCLVIERKAGLYRCSNCGKGYVPSMSSVVFAMHINRTRLLRCPHCGKRAWARKVLRSDE